MNIQDLQKDVTDLTKEIAQIESDLTKKDVISNTSKLQELSKLLPQKKEELQLKKTVLKLQEELADAKEMVETEKDKEMQELAQEEFEKLEQNVLEATKELDEFLHHEEQAQYTDCIMEIRAGTGGEEAGLFASDLARMYAQYAESQDWSVNVLSQSQNNTGGLKEVVFQICGDDAYNDLQYENGVHRVQRVPETESAGRIHTSAASVVVYPLIEEEEVAVNPEEIKIDVYRSSGPGGQSVNTTDSAVRITHIPTGTVVTCQDEKSQHKNRKKALSLLQSKLLDLEKQKQEEEISEIRKSAIKTGDRSAKIRTYNFPQNRVTDHRIKKSWHNLKGIMDGDIEQIIEALRNSG